MICTNSQYAISIRYTVYNIRTDNILLRLVSMSLELLIYKRILLLYKYV